MSLDTCQERASARNPLRSPGPAAVMIRDRYAKIQNCRDHFHSTSLTASDHLTTSVHLHFWNGSVKHLDRQLGFLPSCENSLNDYVTIYVYFILCRNHDLSF
ncbi:hypothetical protein AVEN_251670-1 [Araneus ventricosus]|uniref:Uncharacterized protein n=1 Tax=Araneus ventricosus TaxID=182803 RepID=A0A4Y2HFJ5_ARAVE|nr:hypothetical protein AVEN_251670-1 [Araneus ventricosus]